MKFSTILGIWAGLQCDYFGLYLFANHLCPREIEYRISLYWLIFSNVNGLLDERLNVEN